MPRGEPTVPRHLTATQAATLGKPKAGQYRLTVVELAKLQGISVASPETVAETPSIEVIPSSGRGPATSSRQSLRDRLDAYLAEYMLAVQRQDWKTCDRVNRAREPLFYELWELEKGLPSEDRYWFPAQVINQGQVFQPENVRRGH